MNRFFFSVGEPSGDAHAAELIKALRLQLPNVECVGLGCGRMHHAGCQIIVDMSKMSVMGLRGAITRYLDFRRHLETAKDYLRNNQVSAVVLVDFPGFNWHIAAAAKQLKIPVIYFMPPQIWAWASWRVKKMKRLVDHVLTPLAFEHRWFTKHKVPSTFIGHPFLESSRKAELDKDFLGQLCQMSSEGPLLAVLPGSRAQEVHANLPMMVQTLKIIKERMPNVVPVVASYHLGHGAEIAHLLKKLSFPLPVYVGKTQELIRAADCAIAVSGSVSMELLASNTPAVILYKLDMVSLEVQRFFRRSRFITLVNLLQADLLTQDANLFYPRDVYQIPASPTPEERAAMVMPEYLCSFDESESIANFLCDWLSQPSLLARKKQQLHAVLQFADSVESPINEAVQFLLQYTDYQPTTPDSSAELTVEEDSAIHKN